MKEEVTTYEDFKKFIEPARNELYSQPTESWYIYEWLKYLSISCCKNFYRCTKDNSQFVEGAVYGATEEKNESFFSPWRLSPGDFVFVETYDVATHRRENLYEEYCIQVINLDSIVLVPLLSSKYGVPSIDTNLPLEDVMSLRPVLAKRPIKSDVFTKQQMLNAFSIGMLEPYFRVNEFGDPVTLKIAGDVFESKRFKKIAADVPISRNVIEKTIDLSTQVQAQVNKEIMAEEDAKLFSAFRAAMPKSQTPYGPGLIADAIGQSQTKSDIKGFLKGWSKELYNAQSLQTQNKTKIVTNEASPQIGYQIINGKAVRVVTTPSALPSLNPSNGEMCLIQSTKEVFVYSNPTWYLLGVLNSDNEVIKIETNRATQQNIMYADIELPIGPTGPTGPTEPVRYSSGYSQSASSMSTLSDAPIEQTKQEIRDAYNSPRQVSFIPRRKVEQMNLPITVVDEKPKENVRKLQFDIEE